MSHFTLMTSALSPFSLKIQACLSYTGHTSISLPGEGGKLQNTLQAIKVEVAKRRKTIYKHPKMTELDEYPGVPYFIEPNGRVQYDSSAISRWLDTQNSPIKERKLWPQDPELAFIAQLIDEAGDDFMIHLAHHLRWFHSAATNDAGQRLYEEFSGFPIFSLLKKFPIGFSKRQVSRLPYLFSMPPANTVQDVPNYLKAPIKEGWPETHTLLDQLWSVIILALENILTQQDYLLGDSFTIADASIYGMFGMLLDDPYAEQDMLKRTPTLHRWLWKIKNNQHSKDLNGSESNLRVSDSLIDFLDIIMDTFVPLMKQNEAAYMQYNAQGQTLFNEAAWREEQALFEGELMGYPFKTVTKTFTLQVWRDIKDSWQALTVKQRLSLSARVKGLGEITEENQLAIKLSA